MLSTLVIPFTVQWIPALRSRPSLTRVATPAAAAVSRTALYFESVVPAAAGGAGQPAVGYGRFNFELYLLGKIGAVRPDELSPGGRLAAQFFYDGIFPFVVLLLASYVTPRTDPRAGAPVLLASSRRRWANRRNWNARRWPRPP